MIWLQKVMFLLSLDKKKYKKGAFKSHCYKSVEIPQIIHMLYFQWSQCDIIFQHYQLDVICCQYSQLVIAIWLQFKQVKSGNMVQEVAVEIVDRRSRNYSSECVNIFHVNGKSCLVNIKLLEV
jgi:hypothetical protein